MEKTKVKKHLHLNPEEKKHVAMMVDTGATLAEVDKWYQMRFGKKNNQIRILRFEEKV